MFTQTTYGFQISSVNVKETEVYKDCRVLRVTYVLPVIESLPEGSKILELLALGIQRHAH